MPGISFFILFFLVFVALIVLISIIRLITSSKRCCGFCGKIITEAEPLEEIDALKCSCCGIGEIGDHDEIHFPPFHFWDLKRFISLFYFRVKQKNRLADK